MFCARASARAPTECQVTILRWRPGGLECYPRASLEVESAGGGQARQALLLQPGRQAAVPLPPHPAQGVEGPGVPFTHQNLDPRQPRQPALQPPAGGQGAEPQHLGAASCGGGASSIRS